MNDVTRGRWAFALWNGDFYILETYSGYRGANRRDPNGAQHFLAPNENDEVLGLALLDALAKSRWVLATPRVGSVYPEGVEFDSDLYDYKKTGEHYAIWVKTVMDRYAYKTKKALFESMMSCGVEEKEGVITIRPSHHVKLEAWGGKEEGVEDVVIPSDSTPAEIGAALRLAFSRCTGAGGLYPPPSAV